MSKKNSVDFGLMVVYCALLFCAGVVFGFIFTKDGQVGLVSFFGALSSLAAVGAAVIAVIALHGWKAQFKFQKKYEAVVEFHTYLHGCADAYVYLSSVRDHFAAYIRNGSDIDLSVNFPSEAHR